MLSLRPSSTTLRARPALTRPDPDHLLQGVKVKIIKKRVAPKEFVVKRAARVGTGYVKAQPAYDPSAYDPSAYANDQGYPEYGTAAEQARAQAYLSSTAAAAAGAPPGTAYTQMTAGTDWSGVEYQEYQETGVNATGTYEKMTFG